MHLMHALRRPALLLLVGAASAAALSAATPNASFDIIPAVGSIAPARSGGGLPVGSNMAVVAAADSLNNEAQFLAQYLQDLPAVEAPATVTLRADLAGRNPEAYELTVTPKGITINGVTSAGTFYGIQTLRKALATAPAGASPVLPEAIVKDEPRFAYRGAHFDVCRHFFNTEDVKRFIDMMVLHNLNNFHWHLNEDQGWRIEIKKYPRLVEVASMRDSTVLGHNTDQYDHYPVGGYYTQEQAREIIDYAAKRHINVIPEIDLPGHMLAALTAYPELGCTGGPYNLWSKWGVSEDVLCAGNDTTMAFIKDVLGEIIDLFPSPIIHIGGDESPKTRWESCPKCQARIKAEGIKADDRFTAEQQLQAWVTTQAAKYVNDRGRIVEGWDEILEGDIPQSAIIHSWRGVAGGKEGAQRGHRVVMSPNTYLYFDYGQSTDASKEPPFIGGFLPVEKVYSFDPVEGLTPEQAELIMGPQANMWTEYVKTYPQVEYMELPRMAALAEVGWSRADQRDYADFQRRMPGMLNVYDKQHYHYARHMLDVKASYEPLPQQQALQITLSTLPGNEIRYSIDGRSPLTPESQIYTEPFTVKNSCILRAVAYHNGKPGRVLVDTISVNRATFAEVTLSVPTHPDYGFQGPQTLTDGLSSPDGNYRNGRWLGFLDADPAITIELPQTTEVGSVAFNACVDANEWVLDAASFTVEGQKGKGKWVELASQDIAMTPDEMRRGISRHQASFAPAKVDRLRLTVRSNHAMQPWQPGPGKPAFVFIDEITAE